MSADSQIQKLLQNHPKGFDLSLGRISDLLKNLGNPHLFIPPAFHIAGTNGKGSTSAFLRAIIEASGKTTHVHTSPHLVDWVERYRLGKKDQAGKVGGGKFVSDRALEKAIIEASNANGGRAITVFEIMSAVAFILFSQNKADYSIIEVGLGGRFDATNVIEAPLISIITPIALDHQSYLGDTIEKIAFEKSGIIKKSVPVVIGPQQDAAREVIEAVAQKNGCKTYIARQDFDGFEQRGRFVYQDEWGLLDLPLPNLKGAHQIDNATTAIAASRILKLGLENKQYEEAMRKAYWPGRFERLQAGKLVEVLPIARQNDFDIWIDGGHNPAAGAALIRELEKLKQKDNFPIFMICGMLNTKDPSGFFDHFIGKVAQVFTVPIIDSEAGFAPEELSKICEISGLSSIPAKSVEEALEKISGVHAGAARIIICGSLYLVGDVLKNNGSPPS